jgi:uncharacterized protein YbjT (DUF2867 family)
MKVIITGSLGNISKPLAMALVRQHTVTVVSSKAERQNEIEAIGATAAIGTMYDAEFLTKTFAGADIVYAMESLGEGFAFNQKINYRTAVREIGNAYKQALEQSGVKKLIHLSSIGAHTDKGNGMLAFHYEIEHTLAQLPQHLSIKTMRPVGFYNNMFAYIPTIKSQGAIIQN